MRKTKDLVTGLAGMGLAIFGGKRYNKSKQIKKDRLK